MPLLCFSFRGDEYKSHTVCVSEDQRYGGKDFVAKPVAVKQNSWIEVIKACIEKNQNPKYISIFNRLANNTNLPRKKQKFIVSTQLTIYYPLNEFPLRCFNFL